MFGSASWPQPSQDDPGLPDDRGRADDRSMTTTTHTQALPLVAGRWAVDDNHSSVGFSVRHLGVSKVRGRFNTFDADVLIGETLADTSVFATIDVASIDTGNADRDAHVLSADILDVSRRPTIEFRSTRITGADDNYEIEGDLTIGELTHPVTLAVELGGVETFPGGPRHAGFEATAQLRRKDFDIEVALPPGVSAVALGDVVKIEIDLQLLEPEPAR
jgi:polyisoprenoid-binding protein YceI